MFSIKHRVYYSDTDAGGVVYYARYLDILEKCRTELLRKNNIEQAHLLQNEKLAFMVRECNIKYKGSGMLDDLLIVSVEKVECRGATIIMHQKVYRNNEELIEAVISLVCVNIETKKPQRIPDYIKNLE